MSVSARGATYSMTMSPPPPADLGSYSRSMRQHTKRQMEAASQQSSSLPGMRSQSTSQGPSRSHQSSAGPSAMPNGVSISNASSGMGSSSWRGPAGYN